LAKGIGIGFILVSEFLPGIYLLFVVQEQLQK
jgi:hypothetical protein